MTHNMVFSLVWLDKAGTDWLLFAAVLVQGLAQWVPVLVRPQADLQQASLIIIIINNNCFSDPTRFSGFLIFLQD